MPVAAVNGYFLIGYGARYTAVGGVGVALPQDAMAATVNPAGMAWVPAGWDANMRLMHPHREAAVDCAGIGLCDREVSDRATRERFVAPGFGFVHHVSPRWTLGLSTYSRALYNESQARIFGGQVGGSRVSCGRQARHRFFSADYCIQRRAQGDILANDRDRTTICRAAIRGFRLAKFRTIVGGSD